MDQFIHTLYTQTVFEVDAISISCYGLYSILLAAIFYFNMSERNTTNRPSTTSMSPDRNIPKRNPLTSPLDTPSKPLINLLPQFWTPYIHLSRLTSPAPIFLIYFPHLFGALHTATTLSIPPLVLLKTSTLLFAATFFFSNAAHAWNDLIDAPIDKKVLRTRRRPVASGVISPKAALLFTITQTLLAALFLLLATNVTMTAIATVPTIVGTTYYPWAKRHTNFPQLCLGFCLAWGLVVGSAFVGLSEPWKDGAVMCLVVGCGLWTTVYDTIYAHQDIKDDRRIGVGSLAVFCGERTKEVLWGVWALMGAALVLYGWAMDAGFAYYILAVVGCGLSLGLMIARVELGDEGSCWRWFSSGFWVPGVSITAGLLSEYIKS